MYRAAYLGYDVGLSFKEALKKDYDFFTGLEGGVVKEGVELGDPWHFNPNHTTGKYGIRRNRKCLVTPEQKFGFILSGPDLHGSEKGYMTYGIWIWAENKGKWEKCNDKSILEQFVLDYS